MLLVFVDCCGGVDRFGAIREESKTAVGQSESEAPAAVAGK
jgi:hypothetical protein